MSTYMTPLFPILNGTIFRALPWAMFEPHEAQAQLNHQQTLKRLAERGGLDPCEAIAVLENISYHKLWRTGAEALMPNIAKTIQAEEALARKLALYIHGQKPPYPLGALNIPRKT